MTDKSRKRNPTLLLSYTQGDHWVFLILSQWEPQIDISCEVAHQLKVPVLPASFYWINTNPFDKIDTVSEVILPSPRTEQTSHLMGVGKKSGLQTQCMLKLRRRVQHVDSIVRGARWNGVLHASPFHINRWEQFIAAKPFWRVKI